MTDQADYERVFRAAGAEWPGAADAVSLYSSQIVQPMISAPMTSATWRGHFFLGREAGSRIGGDGNPYVDTNVIGNRYPAPFVVTRAAVLMRSSARSIHGEAMMAKASAEVRLKVWTREPGLVERPMSALPTLVGAGWFFGAEVRLGGSYEAALLVQVLLDVLVGRKP